MPASSRASRTTSSMTAASWICGCARRACSNMAPAPAPTSPGCAAKARSCRAAAARQLLAFAAQPGEVGAGAGAIFEQARLAHPQIHDAAVIDEVVLDALDEAGMRMRMLVGRFRLGQLAGLVVDVIMALAGAIDAIGP